MLESEAGATIVKCCSGYKLYYHYYGIIFLVLLLFYMLLDKLCSDVVFLFWCSRIIKACVAVKVGGGACT